MGLTNTNINTDIKIPSPSEAKALCSGTTSTTNFQNMVSKTISESDNLITALEYVGAMYGIPSTNILVDDSLKSIKVVGDNIIAPSNIKNTIGNTKAIICSIGMVLDNISQRIDDKLNEFQSKEIELRHQTNTRKESNPSKGNVIGRYEDSDGREVIVYDSGFIDAPFTPAGREKANELRESLNLSTYQKPVNTKPSYFMDEDDIAADIDISEDSTDTNIENVDISDSIQESADYIDLMSQFNDTRHLGYDLLQSQGFDYVKTFQESSSSKKQSEVINPEDIKYMKFDNTNIIKAIKFFNDARADQPNAVKGRFKISDLINNSNYQKAIDCLNKQFNARINIRFIEDVESGNGLFTSIWTDIKNNLSISKSKGFQLNGLPIDIFVINKAIDEEMGDDISLFGQFVVSSILHEIFHNIYAVLFKNKAEFDSMLSSTLAIASSIDDAKKRRIILTNYVNALNESNGGKIGRFTRRRLVKRLANVTAFQHDEKMLDILRKQVEDNKELDSDKDIDKLIRMYESYVNKHKKRQSSKLGKVVRTAVGIIFCVSIVLLPIGVGLIASDAIESSFRKKYNNSKEIQEYYCDLFAGMYKLPISFLLGLPNKRKYTSNQIAQEKLDKLAMLEKDIYEINFSIYPSLYERNFAAVKIAKNLLEIDKNIDPSIKKYLEWIVDNHSNILNTNIEEIYNTTTFDPKTAEDLDEHLQNLIDSSKGRVTLTESDVSWIIDDSVVCESADERVNDEGEKVPETCPKCGSKVGLFLKGEPVWLCSNNKCKTYFGVAPCNVNECETVSDIEIVSSLLGCYQEMLTILENYDCCDIGSFDMFQESMIGDAINTAKGSSSEKLILRILKFIPRLVMALVKSMKNSWNSRKDRDLESRIEALEKLSQEQKEKIDELIKNKNNDTGNEKNNIKFQHEINKMRDDISDINRKIDILSNSVKTDLDFPAVIKFFENILEAFSILEKWDYHKPATMGKKSIDKLGSIGIKVPKITNKELKTYSFDDIKNFSKQIIDLYDQISRRGEKIQFKFSKFIEEYQNTINNKKVTPAQTQRFNTLVEALQSVNKYLTLGKTYVTEVGNSFNKLSEEFGKYAQFVNKV